jgi:hypothetical protein
LSSLSLPSSFAALLTLLASPPLSSLSSPLSLAARRGELQAECEANAKLQRRFDAINTQLRNGRKEAAAGTEAEPASMLDPSDSLSAGLGAEAEEREHSFVSASSSPSDVESMPMKPPGMNMVRFTPSLSLSLSLSLSCAHAPRPLPSLFPVGGHLISDSERSSR